MHLRLLWCCRDDLCAPKTGAEPESKSLVARVHLHGKRVSNFWSDLGEALRGDAAALRHVSGGLPGSASLMEKLGFLTDCPNFVVRWSLGTSFNSLAAILGALAAKEPWSLSALLLDLRLKTDLL